MQKYQNMSNALAKDIDWDVVRVKREAAQYSCEWVGFGYDGEYGMVHRIRHIKTKYSFYVRYKQPVQNAVTSKIAMFIYNYQQDFPSPRRPANPITLGGGVLNNTFRGGPGDCGRAAKIIARIKGVFNRVLSFDK